MASPVEHDCGAEAAPAAPSRDMTRCECADVSFAEVARRLRDESISLDEIGRRTGCGRTCTACLHDLRRFLDGR